MKASIRLVILASTIALTATAAWAQDPGQPPAPPIGGGQWGGDGPGGGQVGAFFRQMPKFEDMDKNKDGKISKSEWQGPPQFFDRIDENHDGFIDKEEYAKFQARVAGGGGARFGDLLVAYLDANHDGKVSSEEFSGLVKLFDTLDKDKDGYLTKEEMGGLFQVLIDARAKEAGSGGATGRGGQPGQGGGGQGGQGARGSQGGQGGQGGGRAVMGQLPKFEDLDKNKDGKISKSEWQGPPQFFDRIDENHDGFIDKAEWSRMQTRMGGGRVADLFINYLDVNHDGKISREEFARLTLLFPILDKDHTGYLTKEQMGGFFNAINQAKAQATAGVDVDVLFKKYDKNGDGKITPEELNNEKIFKAMDLNHDGVITRDEAEQFLKAQAERQKQAQGQAQGPAQPK